MKSRSIAYGWFFVSVGACFCLISDMRAESPFEITPDVVYGHKAGMALTYDVIRHKENKNGAAVVFIMSRGWVSPWAPASAFVSESGPEGFKDFPELAAKKHFRQLVEKGIAGVCTMPCKRTMLPAG